MSPIPLIRCRILSRASKEHRAWPILFIGVAALFLQSCSEPAKPDASPPQANGATTPTSPSSPDPTPDPATEPDPIPPATKNPPAKEPASTQAPPPAQPLFEAPEGLLDATAHEIICGPIFTVEPNRQSVGAVAIRHDSSAFAYQLNTAGSPKIVVRTPETLASLCEISLPQRIDTILWSPAGQQLLVASSSSEPGYVALLSMQSGTIEALPELQTAAKKLAIPNAQWTDEHRIDIPADGDFPAETIDLEARRVIPGGEVASTDTPSEQPSAPAWKLRRTTLPTGQAAFVTSTHDERYDGVLVPRLSTGDHFTVAPNQTYFLWKSAAGRRFEITFVNLREIPRTTFAAYLPERAHRRDGYIKLQAALASKRNAWCRYYHPSQKQKPDDPYPEPEDNSGIGILRATGLESRRVELELMTDFGTPPRDGDLIGPINIAGVEVNPGNRWIRLVASDSEIAIDDNKEASKPPAGETSPPTTVDSTASSEASEDPDNNGSAVQGQVPNLPAWGFFKIAKLFGSTPYAKYNEHSRREILKEAQKILKKSGHYRSVIDGDPGPGTHAAIVAWQEKNAPAVTGKLDTETLSAMGLEGLRELVPPPKARVWRYQTKTENPKDTDAFTNTLSISENTFTYTRILLSTLREGAPGWTRPELRGQRVLQINTTYRGILVSETANEIVIRVTSADAITVRPKLRHPNAVNAPSLRKAKKTIGSEWTFRKHGQNIYDKGNQKSYFKRM